MNQPSKNMIIPLSDKKIVDKNERYIEIYKITCHTTCKSYVGQTVSHVFNSGKYRRYGMEKRLRSHISEAFSKKKNQCPYLNNAIRKYGVDDFDVKLLEICSIEEAQECETRNIQNHKTMFPNGYNLKLGCDMVSLSEEARKRVSIGVYKFFQDKKIERFLNLKYPIKDDITEYIRPLNKYKEQYGWYVYIQGKKADFGGKHISLQISRQRAEEFIKKIQEYYNAKHQVAESP